VRAASVVYLHGFASSPRSSKARFFAERVAGAGLAFVCPDLNAPDFRTLTVTRMLDQVDAAIDAMPPGPVTLVGSSLGAFVALHAAERRAARPSGGDHPVDRLLLLAPAVDLVPSLEQEYGPERLRAWEATDRFEVFHYAENRPIDLAWRFMDDARRYDAFALRLQVPTLIFQGTRDDVVSPGSVERWVAGRPWVTLRLVDDGHQLAESLEALWAGAAALLDVGT
jgi:pimeloyl-ACP methyl ester carboxylesterase